MKHTKNRKKLQYKAKPEQSKSKTNKDMRDRKDKNLMINGICLLLGVLILALGIAAPKTIMAMMDKGELNKLYVREVDTDLEADNEPLSVEEKLDLLCGDDANVSVSASRQQPDDRAFEKKILKMAEKEIRTLQEKHIIPDIDLGVYDEESGGYYQIYDGNKVYYSYSCEYFSVVSLDNMNRYVSLALIQYDRGGKYLALLMDTDTGKIYEFSADNYLSEKEAGVYTKENVEAAIREYLGISENKFASYYNLDIWEVTDYETGISIDGFDVSVNERPVYLGMVLDLKKSEQVSTSFGF